MFPTKNKEELLLFLQKSTRAEYYAQVLISILNKLASRYTLLANRCCLVLEKDRGPINTGQKKHEANLL